MKKNKRKIRRICLYSGAGGGKSITATNIRSQLGFKGYDIELVDEVIKDWTYIPRIPKDCDSFYLQAGQIQKEMRAYPFFSPSRSFFFGSIHTPVINHCKELS